MGHTPRWHCRVAYWRTNAFLIVQTPRRSGRQDRRALLTGRSRQQGPSRQHIASAACVAVTASLAALSCLAAAPARDRPANRELSPTDPARTRVTIGRPAIASIMTPMLLLEMVSCDSKHLRVGKRLHPSSRPAHCRIYNECARFAASHSCLQQQRVQVCSRGGSSIQRRHGLTAYKIRNTGRGTSGNVCDLSWVALPLGRGQPLQPPWPAPPRLHVPLTYRFFDQKHRCPLRYASPNVVTALDVPTAWSATPSHSPFRLSHAIRCQPWISWLGLRITVSQNAAAACRFADPNSSSACSR